MIRKRHSHSKFDLNSYNSRFEITDEHGGSGWLFLVGMGQGRIEYEPRPAGTVSIYWHPRSWYVHEWYRVEGTDTPDAYPARFALKLSEGGVVLPMSLANGTRCSSADEANALVETWLAAGGSGLCLEHPDVTKRRRLEAHSNYAHGKASYWFSQMTDEDLLRLSTDATAYITKRVEIAAKAAARAAAKQAKAEEKAKIAAAKAALKAQKLADKEAKAALKAQKIADKEAKAALKAQRIADKAAPV